MKNDKVKLTLLFSFAVFIIMFISMILMSIITILISYYTKVQVELYILILIFALSCLFVGTFFSLFIGKRMLSPIIRISEATKEVAKGNFDIHIDENVKAKEIHDTAKNFNIMIKELDSMEMLKNDFINNVSHEFKSPLAAIEGYAVLLQNPHLSKEKHQYYVSKIISNTTRLSHLTGTILQISRLENQSIEITKNTFSLDEQIRQSILLFEKQWNDKNIQLNIDLQTIDYYGNADLLAQVWQNIIGNAIKFVDRNGVIDIQLKQFDDEIQVIIRDNGIGMDEKTINRIFEKFYQGDTSHSISGNGLGLTLVKRIIDLHDGSIHVDSQKDQGSTFIIKLPLLR